jgi:hypothetical protein
MPLFSLDVFQKQSDLFDGPYFSNLSNVFVATK